MTSGDPHQKPEIKVHIHDVTADTAQRNGSFIGKLHSEFLAKTTQYVSMCTGFLTWPAITDWNFLWGSMSPTYVILHTLCSGELKKKGDMFILFFWPWWWLLQIGCTVHFPRYCLIRSMVQLFQGNIKIISTFTNECSYGEDRHHKTQPFLVSHLNYIEIKRPMCHVMDARLLVMKPH